LLNRISVVTFALPFKRLFAKKEHEMSEDRPVVTQRIARMLRELEGGANSNRGRGTNIAEPATECGPHLKGRMARRWLLADTAAIYDHQEVAGPAPA
jgi:hypothetical protein